ncbi:rhophilin-2-like isoform X2 [Dendronephthya gigantea]|uniref:rhophilin-2-like isoform X2 n=1 Tax=Dendronephthya gigantea TaxID=151771 RepID=UPI001069AFC6|nr:rhophilin-2-like isoform X2 [Dendronephthya gigantea]
MREDIIENLEQFQSNDPLRGTLRGAAQAKRQHLNRQIFKNLRLRDGAEKMLQATNQQPGTCSLNNKKVQDTLRLEISFYDSRLEVLYNELANLKSAFDIYQSAKRTGFPMIAISLKDTVDIEWREVIEDFIESHYHENPEQFRDEIERLVEMRQVMQTPERNEKGVKMLYEYYNQLTLLEKRLFSGQSFAGIQFVWFDSLTAHQTPSTSLAYEKACVLFNIGVLWTQIAAKKEFTTEMKSAQEAIIALQKAVGIFSYLKQSVKSKLSKDLSPEVLDVLVDIFKVQAHECTLNWDMRESDKEDVECYNILAREAAQLSGRYEALKDSMTETASIPPSWCTLAEVKSLHFKAIAHYYAALILLQNYDPDFTDCDHDVAGSEKRLSTLVEVNKIASWLMNEDCRTDKAKSHLKKAMVTESKATQIAKNDRFIARIKSIDKVLNGFSSQVKNKLSSIDISGDLEFIESADDINCSTDKKDRAIQPEFKKYEVEDILAALGPLNVFNAKISYHPPKTVTLNRDEHGGLGISIRGNAPTVICKISPRRQHVGVQVGDIIAAIGDHNTKCLNHKTVSKLIQESGQSVTLTLLSAVSPSVVLHAL